MSKAPEFTRKLEWSRRMRDKILRPFYKEQSRDGQYVCIEGDSPIVKIIQSVYHCDTIVTRKRRGDILTIDEKIRSRYYDDVAIELESCTIPGREKPGWYRTQNVSVEVTLFAFVDGDGNGALCFPLIMSLFRPWFDARIDQFEDKIVDNPMHGENWNTRNKLVKRRLLCYDLGFEPFSLRDGNIVADFFGEKHMEWLK